MAKSAVVLVVVIFFVILFTIQPYVFAQEEEQDPRISPPILKAGNENYLPKAHLMLGPVRLHPFLSEQVTYNDNIYLTQRYRKSDTIFTTEAGFRADLFVLRHSFLLDYRAFVHTYLDETDANNIEHAGNLLCGLKIKNLSVTLKNNYQELIDPVAIWETERWRRSLNEATLSCLYKMRKLDIEVRATNEFADFKKDVFDYFDHTENIFTLIGRYKYSPKTRFLLRGDYGDLRYKEDILNDYTYFQILAGVDGEITGKTRYTLQIGYTDQNADKEPNTAAKEEYSGVSGLAKVIHAISDKTVTEASLLRKLDYSVMSNYQVVDKFEFSFKYQWNEKIGSRARTFFESANFGAVETGIQPRYAWRVGAGLSSWYEIKEYLYVGFDYEYKRKLSRQENSSYTNNKAYFHITLLF